MANKTPIQLTGSDLAKLAIEDLEREVKMGDVIAHCMLRIVSWEYRAGSENPGRVHDTHGFYSAFPTMKVPDEDIIEALERIEHFGFITMRYPDRENDPTGFTVRMNMLPIDDWEDDDE